MSLFDNCETVGCAHCDLDECAHCDNTDCYADKTDKCLNTIDLGKLNIHDQTKLILGSFYNCCFRVEKYLYNEDNDETNTTQHDVQIDFYTQIGIIHILIVYTPIKSTPVLKSKIWCDYSSVFFEFSNLSQLTAHLAEIKHRNNYELSYKQTLKSGLAYVLLISKYTYQKEEFELSTLAKEFLWEKYNWSIDSTILNYESIGFRSDSRLIDAYFKLGSKIINNGSISIMTLHKNFVPFSYVVKPNKANVEEIFINFNALSMRKIKSK